jgi:hypothetical protein
VTFKVSDAWFRLAKVFQLLFLPLDTCISSYGFCLSSLADTSENEFFIEVLLLGLSKKLCDDLEL